jgi:hypothetical protein
MALKESLTPQIADFFNDIDPERSRLALLGPPSRSALRAI